MRVYLASCGYQISFALPFAALPLALNFYSFLFLLLHHIWMEGGGGRVFGEVVHLE